MRIEVERYEKVEIKRKDYPYFYMMWVDEFGDLKFLKKKA